MLNPQLQLVTFQLLIWIANCDNFSSSNKLREIISLTNNIGQLPCPIISLDDVAMILWFKDSSGSPIYSYDARMDKEPRHLAMQNDWGPRLYFRVWPNMRRSPALIIKYIQPSDEGNYRCRIDYRTNPTTNYVMKLIVLQPPTHIEILDVSTSLPISDQQIHPSTDKQSDITHFGPYQEGQNVTLRCNAYGGKPLPEVKWFKNGAMIDSVYELVGSNYAVNELLISNLGSQHSADLYVCQASNNNESKAISHSVSMDVYLKVKEIDLEVPDEMTAGAEYTLICRTNGAYPIVKMEFSKMQKRLGPKYQTRSEPDNVTTYTLSFKPEILDDEESISCKAENPWLKDKPLVARRTLKIKYTPVVILRFGTNKTENFTSGEIVLIECHVKANPPFFSISWFHGKNQLFNNETSGVRITGITLILTNLKTDSGGKYFCQAANVIGKAMSNPLTIAINIAPKCASSEVISIPLAIGESHKLGCYILAWPPDLNFYWILERSNDIVPILPMSLGNHTQGYNIKANSIEDFPLADFDEYIFPITRAKSDSTSRVEDSVRDSDMTMDENSGAKNFTGSSSSFSSLSYKTGRNVTGLSLTDTEESEGGSDGNPTKASTYNHLEQHHNHHPRQRDSYYLRMRRKSPEDEIQEKELKSVDKKEGLKGGPDVLIHSRGGKSGPGGGESLYGRWKALKDDSPDNIYHEASMTYTIRSIEDYGLVACSARNSFGRQLSPCLFRIVSISRKEEANQDETVGDRGNGSLTRGTYQAGQDVRPKLDQRRESGILVPSKLPMTSSIILMALLIFIASFGLFLLLLVMLAKRRRQIRRMIMTNKKQEENEPSGSRSSPFSSKNTPISYSQVRSSTMEKCTSSIFLLGSCIPTSASQQQHPLCTMGNDLSLNSFPLKTNEGSSSDGTTSASCLDLTSESTTFTVISTQNDFPPPPTSISTSHGYGSIEEEEDEDEEVVRHAF